MATTDYGRLVLLEKRDAVGWITLNRPEKRNAMNGEAQSELRAALADCKQDCRVIVLTGEGRAFCSGIDLSERRGRADGAGDRVYAHGSESWLETNEHIRMHPAITIAAVNGYALGGGLTLTHNCELAIASDRAEFGMPEVGFNVFPGLAGPATARRMLPKHTAYMVLTTKRIDAVTAERWGIVNEVVPHDVLRQRADELARHIAQFDPVVLDHSKKALRDLELMPWSESLVYGGYVNAVIRGRRPNADDPVGGFLQGRRNPGQGATPEP